jgi:hypothetical protein
MVVVVAALWEGNIRKEIIEEGEGKTEKPRVNKRMKEINEMV